MKLKKKNPTIYKQYILNTKPRHTKKKVLKKKLLNVIRCTHKYLLILNIFFNVLHKYHRTKYSIILTERRVPIIHGFNSFESQ